MPGVHEAIVPAARVRVGDGMPDDAHAVFYEADAFGNANSSIT